MNPKFLKIIHIIPSIEIEHSGPSYSVPRLVKSLREYANVSLYSVNFGLTQKKIKENSYERSFKPSFGGIRLGRSSKLLNQLILDAKNYKFLILHNHGMWQFNALYASWIRERFHNCKLVQSPRGSLSNWSMRNGSLLKKIYWPLYQKKALELVDLFHVTSQEEYIDTQNLNFKKNIIYIPNGIDLPKYKNRNEKRKGFNRLLFLSRLHPKKGLNLLIEAWSEVNQFNKEWELIIVGDDKDYRKSSGYKNQLINMVNQFNLTNIKFLGPLHGKEKQRIYENVDCFILPSFSENFGLVVGEAMSYKLPVITTKRTHWIQIEEKKAGWLIDPTVESIKNILQRLFNLDKKNLETMGNNGYKLIKDDYKWEDIGEKLYKEYIKLFE